ncbi:MAG: helix-turn-helix domain-containing protein [Paracoccaceae bacterium]
MNQRPDIHNRLAASLKAARKSKGLSLDAVARLSGVSRSMVSQIERAESSPTVATLWNLTQALQVDFAGLIENRDEPGIEVMRGAGAPIISGRGDGVRIRILSPAEAVGDYEVYDVEFEAGSRLDSDPHGPGCREHLTVISGTVEVSSGDARQWLNEGDTARYPADRPHRIVADSAARVLLIVQNG